MGLVKKIVGWMQALSMAASLVATAATAAVPARADALLAVAPSPAASLAALPKGRCIDDDGFDPIDAPISLSVPASASSLPLGDASNPSNNAPGASRAASESRTTLLALVRSAIHHSNAVGAARLLAEAAAIDIDEERSARLPQVTLNGSAGGLDAGAPNTASTHGGQYQGSVSAGGPIFDFGRIEALSTWRTHLAEAARLGEISAQEQVALQTVSLALDRSRFVVEAQVYDQYAKKMACLVGALQDIVSADRGRMSELVQARKTQQQAELMRDQTLSQKRLTEVRLRRFVGDELPPADGLTPVLIDTPSLPDLVTIAARTTDIVALDEQANAQDAYVRAILDGQKPQIGWLIAATKSAGAGPSRQVSGAITLSVPLFNPAINYTTSAARKRAEAARLQREDALEERKERLAEVHEQAEHAMDRARHVVEILHNSEKVRESTLEQWQALGRRSLFDVMAAEGDHYSTRVQYVDAIFDTQQSNALLWSLGLGLAVHLQ